MKVKWPGLKTAEIPPHLPLLSLSTSLWLCMHWQLSMQPAMILVDHFSVSDLYLASPADLAASHARAFGAWRHKCIAKIVNNALSTHSLELTQAMDSFGLIQVWNANKCKIINWNINIKSFVKNIFNNYTYCPRQVYSGWDVWLILQGGKPQNSLQHLVGHEPTLSSTKVLA